MPFRSSTLKFDSQYNSNVGINYKLYSKKGNLLEWNKQDDVPNCTLWGYKETLPIAQIKNAFYSQIAYTGFEDNSSNSSWEVGTGLYNRATNPLNVYTGNFSYRIPPGNPSFGPTKNLTLQPQSGIYRLSAWVKTSSLAANGKLVIYTMKEGSCCNGYPTAISAQSSTAIYNTQDQWKYYEVIIDLDKVRSDGAIPAGVNLTLRCYIENNNPTEAMYVDDVRIYPVGAFMNTFTYAPLVGITSQTNENSVTQHVEYDGLQRPAIVRDQDKNIIKKFTYVFKP